MAGTKPSQDLHLQQEKMLQGLEPVLLMGRCRSGVQRAGHKADGRGQLPNRSPNDQHKLYLKLAMVIDPLH